MSAEVLAEKDRVQMLDIYAGKKHIVRLQVHSKKGEDKIYAIPGRKLADEKQIRKWAKKFGYLVKNVYENLHST